MSARIIPLSEEFRIPLAEYMRKTYPSFTKDYIDYNVNEGIFGNQK